MDTQTPTADSSKAARIALKTMIVPLLLALKTIVLGGVGDDTSSAKLYKPFCRILIV